MELFLRGKQELSEFLEEESRAEEEAKAAIAEKAKASEEKDNTAAEDFNEVEEMVANDNMNYLSREVFLQLKDFLKKNKKPSKPNLNQTMK